MAWVKAAKSKNTHLNIVIVLECINKQRVAFAKRVFGEDIEVFMNENGYGVEVEFVKLIRHWFEAEDNPGISSTERCSRRLRLRKYLLNKVNFGKFPPETQYIMWIPCVTFEALLVHIERKLQLYRYILNRCYNVRALGTQEVEQFFSTIRDLDPSGLGTPKPDDIPDIIATAAWLNNIRMNLDRSFFMKTTRATVYPEAVLERHGRDSESETNMEVSNSFYATENDNSTSKDHFFDLGSRRRVKPKHKSGEIAEPDKPAYRQLGGRQYHICDDSKVLAEYRVKDQEKLDCVNK